MKQFFKKLKIPIGHWELHMPVGPFVAYSPYMQALP